MKRLTMVLILSVVAAGWSAPHRYNVVVVWSKVLGDYLRSQGDSPYLAVIQQEALFNQTLENSEITNFEMNIIHAEEITFNDVPYEDCGKVVNLLNANNSYTRQLQQIYSSDIIYYLRKNIYRLPNTTINVGGCANAHGGNAGTSAFNNQNYDFSHEVGHILGLHHDLLSEPVYKGYKRGYRIKDDNVNWGTIMSNARDYTMNFSNPDVVDAVYGPTGIPYDQVDPAHASRWIELVAPIVTERKLTKPDLQETMIHENLSKERSVAAYYFKMFVPAFHENPRIILEDGTGDADLYVGLNQFPTLRDDASIECSSTGSDNYEECSVSTDFWRPESLYIMVRAYSAFEGATLRAEIDPPAKIAKNYPALNLTGSYSDQYFMAELPEAATNVVFSLTSQNGEHQYANLEIFTYNDNGEYLHCTGAIQGDKKVCSFSEGGDYYITINGTAFSGVTLSVDYSDVFAGNLTRDVWDNVPGVSVSDLTRLPYWEDEYSSTSLISQFEGPTNVADDYASRIHGIYHPPMTGYYTFYIAGDDNCELWLSSDEKQENVQLVAYHDSWTNPRDWDDNESQKSEPIFLTTNKGYYIKALHKEGQGGDNIAVAVESEFFPREVIQGHSMDPFPDTKGPNKPVLTVHDNYTTSPSIQIQPGGGGIGLFEIEQGYSDQYKKYSTENTTISVEPVAGRHWVRVRERDVVGNKSAISYVHVEVIGVIEKDVEITVNHNEPHTFLLDVPENYTPGTLEVSTNFPGGTSFLTVHFGTPWALDPSNSIASCYVSSSDVTLVCNSDNANHSWEQSGQWYITVEFVYSEDPLILLATYETDDTPAPPPPGEPGLYYGTVSGNINTTTANPKTSITTSLSETENGIGGNTTEIYTGMIYDADGKISFTEDMDDKIRLYIDGNLVLSSDSWSDRTSTGNLNLSAGWHEFELRISNGSGGSGPHSSPGFGYDPNGGTNWIHPSDPGDGSLFSTQAPQDGGPQTGVPYSVKYEHSGKCLGVVNGSRSNAANVEQQTCSGASHQKLVLEHEQDGYYSLHFQHSGQVVDINGGSYDNGASVIQWPLKSIDQRTNQMFELVDHGNGTYSFKFRHSGRCVDIDGVSRSDGANVIQWDCHYNANQRFRFE